MICLCGGLITEALCSGTSNSKNPVLQSIAITQYGDYEIKAPEGVDGYNPIHVNLKDRYDEGYADGEAAVKAKIQSKTITANGTYSAAADGLDGFDPVIVNVGGTHINGTIYNPNDPDKNYPIVDPTITNADDIDDIIGDTVISPGNVVTVTGIDGNADCAVRIYVEADDYGWYYLYVESVNLITGKTDRTRSLYGYRDESNSITLTKVWFENHYTVHVEYTITTGYGGRINQQAAWADADSYGTAVAVTSGALP